MANVFTKMKMVIKIDILIKSDQVVFKDASEQKDLHDKFFGYDFDSDPDKG